MSKPNRSLRSMYAGVHGDCAETPVQLKSANPQEAQPFMAVKTVSKVHDFGPATTRRLVLR